MIDLIVLENIRSAYNVGNVIRTCDALGYGAVISGYTPHPSRDTKVAKSAL
jgi:tRNA G18 (ribose-2'-O)-methylase SpoU